MTAEVPPPTLDYGRAEPCASWWRWCAVAVGILVGGYCAGLSLWVWSAYWVYHVTGDQSLAEVEMGAGVTILLVTALSTVGLAIALLGRWRRRCRLAALGVFLNAGTLAATLLNVVAMLAWAIASGRG